MATGNAEIMGDMLSKHAILVGEYKALQKAYKSLEKKFKQLEETSVTWSVRDFMDYDCEGYEITKARAESALKEMIRRHDCNDGITWNTLEFYYTEWGTKIN